MASRVDDLTRLRDLLWDSIEAADPEKRAPLAARIESVLAQIDELSPTEKAGGRLDEIAARRTARGGATARLGQASGRPG